MSQNNHFDPNLIRQLDRLIETQQQSGIPLADDLADTIPQARADFQRQLEDYLVTQIRIPQNEQGDEELVTFVTTSTSNSDKKRTRFPFTLVAAILAVLLVGSVWLTRGGNAPNSGLAVIIQATASATPVPSPTPQASLSQDDLFRLQQLHDLQAQIENLQRRYDDLVAAADGLTSEAERTQNAEQQTQTLSSLRELKQLYADLSRGLQDTANLIGFAGVGSEITSMPSDRVGVSLPLNLLSGDTDHLVEGVQVDITAAAIFVDPATTRQCPCGNALSQVIMQPVARNALVIHVGDFLLSTATTAPDIITLAVSLDEAQTLTSLVNADIPMRVSETLALAVPPSMSGPDANTAMPPIPTVAEPQPEPLSTVDRVNITVPIEQINPFNSNLQKGDHVSITAKFIFALTSNENFQALATIPPIDLPVTPGQPVPAVPSDNHGYTVEQTVIQDAPVVGLDSSGITVAVTGQEAAILQWVLDAKLPLTIQPASSAP